MEAKKIQVSVDGIPSFYVSVTGNTKFEDIQKILGRVDYDTMSISLTTRSAPSPSKKVAKKNPVLNKKTQTSKGYITEKTFDKVLPNWRNEVSYVEVQIMNMYVIREIWFYLSFSFREDSSLTKEEQKNVNYDLLEANYGKASSDIKNGNLEKVSSDLVLSFFSPSLLKTLEDNDIKIMAKDAKRRSKWYELKPKTYITPELSDDT